MIPVLHLGPIAIPTYFLVISLVVSIGIIWSVRRSNQLRVSQTTTLNIDLVIMLAGFFGARMMHVFYENPAYYMQYPYAVFYIWQGGFVYLGGALTAGFATWLYCRIQDIDFLPWADFYAPILSFGYGVGRLGCFLNGCCYGRICDVDGSRYPTQLMAFGFEMLILASLLLLEKKRFFKAPGQLFFFWVLLHSVSRMIMEFYRDDDRGATLLNISISSWISLFLWVTSALFLWRLSLSKRQTF